MVLGGKGDPGLGAAQEQAELGAAVGMVAHVQLAAQGTAEGIADRQAEAEALGAGLGGEERLAGALQRFCAETRAIVAQAQQYTVALLLGTQPDAPRRRP